jgi:transposase-like protein
MSKQHITLSDGDRSTLARLLSGGTLRARTFKRATALLELDRGKTLADVAATLSVNYNTVASWRDGYGKRSFDAELQELAKRIERLPPERATDWCNQLEQRWSATDVEIRGRSELLTMCRIQRVDARMRGHS